MQSDALEQARAAYGVDTAHLTDGATAYVTEGCEGPWVVLIHGLLTPMFAWEPLSRHLSQEGFRVLRYDQFGRGLSDRPNVTYDPGLYLRQLRELTASLGIEDMHLVGWSMGGVLAPRFTLDARERVRSLTLIAPALYLHEPLLVRALLWFERGRALLGRNVARAVARLQQQHLVYPERFPHYSDRSTEQLLFPGVGASFVSTLQHFPWGAGPELRPLREHAPPTLVVWGTEDKTTPYRNARRVRKLLPEAEWLVIEGARHGLHLDHREQVEPVIARHLKRA